MSHSTSSSLLQSNQQVHLNEQAAGEHIRRLVAHCQELTCQYQTTPVVVLERAWWRSLYRAGICLRDALEQARDRWHMLCLTNKEAEYAYFILIRVAYFFDPGGVAEAVFQEQGWVWSDKDL